MINSSFIQRMTSRARNLFAEPAPKVETAELEAWIVEGDAMASLIKHPAWHRYETELKAAYDRAVGDLRMAKLDEFAGAQAKLNAIVEIQRIPLAAAERGLAAREQLDVIRMGQSLNRLGDE